MSFFCGFPQGCTRGYSHAAPPGRRDVPALLSPTLRQKRGEGWGTLGECAGGKWDEKQLGAPSFPRLFEEKMREG